MGKKNQENRILGMDEIEALGFDEIKEQIVERTRTIEDIMSKKKVYLAGANQILKIEKRNVSLLVEALEEGE